MPEQPPDAIRTPGEILRGWSRGSWVYLVLVMGVVAGIGFAVDTTLRTARYDWDWARMGGYFLRHTQEGGLELGVLSQGFFETIRIAFFGIVGGLIIGVIVGICRVSKDPVLRAASALYVEVLRNTPLIVQILLFYTFFSGFFKQIPFFDRPDALGGGADIIRIGWWCGVISLAMIAGAYIGEVVRGGIQAIGKGQWEAAHALGMNDFQTMRHIILPQAFRIILPPVTNEFATLVKDSSLVFIIGIQEMFYWGRQTVAREFRAYEVYLSLAIMYFLVCFALSRLVKYLERRMRVKE